MLHYLYLISKYRKSLMGIAILWIMMFHLPLHPKIPILNDIFNIGYGGVDIFLFLSGFGLYFSLSKKRITLSQYYKKRFCRILPEFWIFLIGIYFISMDFSFHSLCVLIYQATTIGYWIPHTPYTLWYISCILFFYIIFPFYYNNLKKKGLRIGIIAICIGLALTIIYAFVMITLFANKNSGGLLILTIARIPIFFIGSIVGYFVKENIKLKNQKEIILIALILFFAAIILLVFFRTYLPNYLWTCSLSFLPFIIITPILCILIAQILDKILNFSTILFSQIGAISLELYIVHEYIYSKLIGKLSNYYGEYIAITIAITLSFLSALILYYINKTFLQKICKKILHL